jgi:hypothetical protein
LKPGWQRSRVLRVKTKTNEPTRYIVLIGARSLGIRSGECYVSDGSNLVLESPRRRLKIVGPVQAALATGRFKRCDPLLPYPLVTIPASSRSRSIQRYEIPKMDRTKVLKRLWIYAESPPPLSATRFDLIAEKLFKVGEFVVIREFETNLLLSPHGGSVIDWAPASWGRRQLRG